MKLDYSKLFDRMKSENIKHLDLKKRSWRWGKYT